MSKVRHVYADDDEYIAVHRKKKSTSYTCSGGSCYTPVAKPFNWASAIARLIAAILIIGMGFSICGIFSILWVGTICFGLAYNCRGAEIYLYLAFSAAPTLLIPGIFCDLGGAFLAAIILGPVISVLAHIFDD